MQDSIFTKIIKGELPAHIIYEDEQTIAFLDIHPKQPGHTLVVSKQQIKFVWDLPAMQYQALMETVQRVALRLREVLAQPFIGEQVEGIDVPHAHVHVIPFAVIDELRAKPNMQAEPDHQALQALAIKLAF